MKEDRDVQLKSGGTAVIVPHGVEGIIKKVLEILHVPCVRADIEIHVDNLGITTIDYHIYGGLPSE